MSGLKLFLLGPPQVKLDETPIDFERRKVLALLIYLAVSGQAHSRDTLATLFWPDSSQSRARSYLRRELAILNSSLESDWLISERETVELNHNIGSEQTLWLDVAHFRWLLAECQSHDHPPEAVCSDCLPLLTEAVGLYRDDFLAGFTLRDSSEFDDWQFFQTESLRLELTSALERLVQAHNAQGKYEAAIPYARRWLALDPLHEPAQQQLMQLYAQSGQQSAALRQYEEYVKLLEEELGLPPEEETTTLYEAIKSKRILKPFFKTAQPQPVVLPDRQATLTLAAQHRDSGNYAAAIDLLQPLLARYPADEVVHRELMRLYALAGRRHEALRQYQTCCGALSTDLKVLPDPETEALYRQIVNGEVTPSFAPTPKPAWLPPAPIMAEVERSVPLAGREKELETLQAKIRTGWHGQGYTVLLAGEAGVGKTRLAYEALRAAALSRMTTLAGAAYEQEGHLPYEPFVEAFDRFLAEQQRPPEQNPITHYQPLGSTDLQQEHTALFKTTSTFLMTLATRSPVVLLLDDLHTADEASLSLFHYLARQTRSAPVILLATYRIEAAFNAVSPFGSLLNALYREHLSDTLHLTPLPEQAGAKIIAHILDGEADPVLIKAIFDIAEGNPFFIQEITRAMLKADRLIRDNGLWRLQSGATPWVPSELREVLRERVQRLGPTVEAVLTAAAVIGREFRFAVLREVADLPDGDLLDALDTALSGHLLEETEDGYRFHHSLIRHTLYNAVSRARRAWLHAATAQALETNYAARPQGLKPHVEALAFHYDLSNRRDQALPYLLQAGQKAADIYALEAARDYFERALALMNELDLDDPAQRWQILEQLGQWALILADTARAVAYFEEALALATLPPSPNLGESDGGWQPSLSDRVRLHRLAARTLITAGQAPPAEQHLQTAMEAVVDSGQASLDYARLLYEVALWHWHRNEGQEAFEIAQRSLNIAERLNDTEAIARGYEVMALACHSLGDWQQGLDFEERRSALVGPDFDVTEAFDIHL